MAANDVIKKLQIYHTLYRLNVSFSNIFKHCQALRDAGIVTAKQVRLFQGYTQELQAEINEGVLAILYDVELDDWSKFGKVRQAEDKRLEDPDDVFIHAKERQQELKKKSKR
ncbi:MAG TPA: hypothetical protein VGK22_03515 [Candidatus Angelobacter sp.]|jgi:hypothetical protein